MSLGKTIRRLRDVVRFSLNQWRYGYKPVGCAEDFAWANLHHLVIAKMDGKLGDTQVITPFIASLRENCPQLQLSVVATANVASLYADILGLHTVTVPIKADPIAVQQAIASDALLSSLPCDALLTTEPNFRARDLCLNKLLQPRYIIGIEERSGAVNLNLKTHSLGKHITQYFADLLVLGGINTKFERYTPLCTAQEQEWAEKIINVPGIGIAPYGASRHRRLSDDLLVQLVDFLTTNTSFKLALLFDVAPSLQVKLQAFAPERFIYKPQATTASQYAALIASCKGIISVDSAAVHLSNAARVPAFCLYAGLDPDGIKRWGPAPFAPECVSMALPGKRIDELSFADIKAELFAFLQSRFDNTGSLRKE